ncbi:MAG TPA: hypothetical protein VFR47_19700 [Anaerolineales bacterium]|nr:hypothetical protein [Anaerolineales bacterium]
MNYFQDEQTAAYNRQRIAEAFHQIRLEELALKSRVYQPGRFERMMFNFANWMISTGKQLRKRYEIPDANCTPVQSKSFAR